MTKRLLVSKRALGKGVGKQTQQEAQEKYFLKVITTNPKYELLLASLKEGVSASEIARHFAMNNWITINERSFTEAVRVFKRLKPELIDATDVKGLHSDIDANSPELDEITVIDQLLRLQSRRIAIDFQHEKTMGKLFNTTAKEIEVTTKLLETRAKIKGKLNERGGHQAEAMPVDVNERLNTVKKDQTTRDRLTMLVKQVSNRKTVEA
jgi:hypothetical protein